MKKIFLAILFLAFLTGAVAVISFNKSVKKNSFVCFDGNCFGVELAKTEKERSLGLMFRESLDSDKGMLFIFEKEGIYPFWMENTKIFLDIIWIDSERKIVFMRENAPPCPQETFCLPMIPENDAQYVLELNGGVAREIGLKIGAELSFKF